MMAGPVLILVDIAHPDSARALLTTARDRFGGGEVHVAYVMPYGFYSYVEPFVSEDSQKAAADRARAELSALLAEAQLTDAVTPHVLRGGIGEQSLRLAEKVKAEVIVLNAMRGESSYATLGTHAAQIARHAPCSVFLVRG